MKKKMLFISLCGFCFLGMSGLSFAEPVAQNNTEKVTVSKELTSEERKTEILKNKFNDSEVYTPYRALMMYNAALENQKNLKDKNKVLKMLSDSFEYEPEELSALSEKMEETPVFENLLDPEKQNEMNRLIQTNTPEALIQITSSRRFNEAYLPSDKEDDEPLLGENTTPTQTKKVQTPTFPTQDIISVQKIYSEHFTPNRKRLGYKSYNINPDNFEYEKNK